MITNVEWYVLRKQKYKWHTGCSVIKQAGKENHSVSDN